MEDYIYTIDLYPAIFSTWVSVHQHKDSERRATDRRHITFILRQLYVLIGTIAYLYFH
jgi:hypothetical protein